MEETKDEDKEQIGDFQNLCEALLLESISNLTISEQNPGSTKNQLTKILIVEQGLEHNTGEVHQENIHRLERVSEDLKQLSETNKFLRYERSKVKAELVDLLAVHEYDYIEHLKSSIFSGKQFLDSDTRLSANSWKAALFAAGAVIQAVDEVVSKKARNVFIAGRPPGHHAGPRGAVPSTYHYQYRPEMCSNGFCLLNNVAIGAAYARRVYGRKSQEHAKHAGSIEKIAIVDFDIHDGNGTSDIIRNLVPSERNYPLPPSWARKSYKSYKPWLNEEDPKCVLFSSIHLYEDGGGFYPGSGSLTENSKEGEYPIIVNIPLHPVISIAQKKQEALRSRQGLPPLKRSLEAYRRGSTEFRESIENKLLPRLKEFNPDLLFISAGKSTIKHYLLNVLKDLMGIICKYQDLNVRYRVKALLEMVAYHVLTEEDYFWFTKRLKHIADSCCEGRLISVLEGGYHLERHTFNKGSRKSSRRGSKEGQSPTIHVDSNHSPVTPYSNEAYGNTGALVTSCRAHVSALVCREEKPTGAGVKSEFNPKKAS